LILIDYREPDEIRRGIPGAEVTTLEYGDFAFEGEGPEGPVLVGLERKTITDLINSMKSGRLAAHQMVGMKRTYNHTYLLIEGIYRRDKDGCIEVLKGRNQWWGQDLKVDAINNFVNDLAVVFGVIPLFPRGSRDTCLTVVGLAMWWGKPWALHSAYQGMDYYDSGDGLITGLIPPSTVTRMAFQLQGVGKDKAAAIGERFQTPKEMCDATEEDWKGIDGIGKTLAKRITQIVRGEGKG